MSKLVKNALDEILGYFLIKLCGHTTLTIVNCCKSVQPKEPLLAFAVCAADSFIGENHWHMFNRHLKINALIFVVGDVGVNKIPLGSLKVPPRTDSCVYSCHTSGVCSVDIVSDTFISGLLTRPPWS